MSEPRNDVSNRPLITIVNRNYPPRPGITGESARELAEFLQSEHGAEIVVFTVRSSYVPGAASNRESVGNVKTFASLYDGKRKLPRLFASFIESFRLVWAARRKASTRVIVMTDPPFLSFWAALLLRKKNWTLWAMDLYPDAFLVDGLVSPNNWFYRWHERVVYCRPPQQIIALGPLQLEYLKQKYSGETKMVVLPCGVFDAITIATMDDEETREEELPAWKRDQADKIILGYCGNLGQAHSVRFLKAILEQLDASKFHLVLACYGSKAASLLQFVGENSEGVSLVKSVPQSQLKWIDVHLVSLKPNWNHVCVPSKAVSSVCSGSTMLFYGSDQCDNWKLLQPAGWRIAPTEDDGQLTQSVAEFLAGLTDEALAEKKAQARVTGVQLNQMMRAAFNQIGQTIADRTSRHIG